MGSRTAPTGYARDVSKRAASGEGSLRKRPNGTYELRFRHCGVSVSVYGSTPAAVRKARNAKLAELGDPSTQAQRRSRSAAPTLRVWTDEWLDIAQTARGTPRAERTTALYRGALSDLLKRFGAQTLDQLDGRQVMQWIRTRYRTSPSQQFHASAAVRAALAAAIEAGKLPRAADPFEDVKRIPQPPRSPKRKHWTADEVREVLSAAAHVDAAARFVRCRPALVLQLGTGCRPNELFGLRPDSIDRDVMSVAFLSQRGGAPLKRNSIRTVEVGPEVIAATSDLLAGRTDTRYLLGFEYDGYDRALAQACKLAEVPWIGCHGPRHTAATAWLRAGVSLPDVARRLGHKDPATTATIYAHALAGGDRRALTALPLGD